MFRYGTFVASLFEMMYSCYVNLMFIFGFYSERSTCSCDMTRYGALLAQSVIREVEDEN